MEKPTQTSLQRTESSPSDEELLAILAQIELRERQEQQPAAATTAAAAPSVLAAAAAAAAPNITSLYDELVRFQEEHGDQVIESLTQTEAPPTQTTRQQSGRSVASEDDRKPPARASLSPSSMGTYRPPISREYFRSSPSHSGGDSSSSVNKPPPAKPVAEQKTPPSIPESSLPSPHSAPARSNLSSLEEQQAYNISALSNNPTSYQSPFLQELEGQCSSSGMNDDDNDDEALARRLQEQQKIEDDSGSVQSSLSSGSIPPPADDACEIRQQQRILERIRQEKEAADLQRALQLSEQESLGPSSSITPGWQQSQQMALSEYQLPPSSRRRPPTESSSSNRQQYLVSLDNNTDDDSEREEMLRRGQLETQDAIRRGQAHIVQCQGCQRRLQAPIHYSLVYCPTCGVVSPGQSINSRYNARNSL